MKEHIQNFLIVSIAYITAFSLTLGFVSPLQQMLLSNVISELSVLFLPHGVRVLAFYFLGWRAIFYLLPSSYLFLALSNHAGSQLDLMSPIISMVACYLGYRFATLLPMLESRAFTPGLWRFLIVAGAISSFANGIALSILQHQGAEVVSLLGYLIGDISGLLACFLILMYTFRFVRLLATVNDA